MTGGGGVFLPRDVVENAKEAQRRPECGVGGGDAQAGMMQKER